MVNRVEVSPLAEKEIEESFDWYEKEAAGLGIRFILSIDEAIDNIVAKRIGKLKLIKILTIERINNLVNHLTYPTTHLIN
jgi:plasmid stabilization system protein ParE